MNDLRAGFLETICADPDDDAPRLVYSDWLDEHGDETRAEFIRAQVELARLQAEDSESQAVFVYLLANDRASLAQFDWEPIDPGVARRWELFQRTSELAKQHQKTWKAEAAPRCGILWTIHSLLRNGMERGFFAEGVLRGLKTFAKKHEELFRTTPLQTVELTDHQLVRDLGQLELLVDSGALVRLSGLRIRYEATLIELLSQSEQAEGIRRLTFTGSREATSQAALALARSRRWRNLQELQLNGVVFGEAAHEFFRARHLRGLASLRMGGTFRIEELAEFKFPSLRSLSLNCHINDQGAQILANTPSLKKLRTLELSQGDITAKGLAALLESPYLKRLAVLDLASNAIGRFDSATVGRGRKPSLRVLDLRGAEVTHFTGCPALDGLTWLGLGHNDLANQQVRALAQSSFERLAVLDLINNEFGTAGAAAIADWATVSEIRRLHLQGNSIGDAGAMALANSPYLGDVAHLCVLKESVGEASYKALRKRFGKAVRS